MNSFVLRFCVLLAGTLTLSSCVSLTPVGEAVVEVENAAAVTDCENLGEVTAPPPFILPTDAEYTLRNEAGALGGNSLLITDQLIGTAKGIAYKCG